MIDVVNEQQNVMIFVMEFFSYGQIGQSNVQMVFWWFVYLVIYQGYFVDNVGVGYFVVEVVIFMSMFIYVCKYRVIGVFDCDVMNELYYVYGFIYICIIEQINFIVFSEWIYQVDNFDIGFQQFLRV